MMNKEITNNGVIRLSVRQVCELKKDDFCPRCFWFKYHYPITRSNPYYSVMPGIVSSFDSYIKTLIHSYFEEKGELPPWLKNIFNFSVKEILRVNKLEEELPKNWNSNNQKIILSGVPDALWLIDDNTLCIVDFKLANYNETQEKLLPVYTLQLNLYALLNRIKNEKITVSKLFLLYFQPLFKISSFKISNEKEQVITSEDDFKLQFNLKIIRVEMLEIDEIKETINKACTYITSQSPPNGKEGCQGCEEILRWISKIKSKFFFNEKGETKFNLYYRRKKICYIKTE